MFDSIRYYYFRFRPLWVTLFAIALLFACVIGGWLAYLHLDTIREILVVVLVLMLVAIALSAVWKTASVLLPKDPRKKKKHEEKT